MDEFYMILPSNSCPRTQPNNSASKFIVDWENPIELEGKWKAALTEFTATYRLPTISKEDFIWIQYKIPDIPECNLYVGVKDKKYYEEFDETFEKYYTAGFNKKNHLVIQNKKGQDFKIHVANIEGAVKTGYTKHDYTSSDGILIANRPRMDGADFVDYRLKILVTPYGRNVETNFVRFPEDVCSDSTDDIFKYIIEKCKPLIKEITIDKDRFITMTLANEVVSLDVSSGLSHLLGIRKFCYVDMSGTLRARKPSNFQSALKTIYIYSSLTEPVLVGGTYVPLLKSIFIKHVADCGTDNLVHVDIKHPMYIPISSWSINKVEVNIRDDSGQLLSFTHGSITSLTVHFKKNE